LILTAVNPIPVYRYGSAAFEVSGPASDEGRDSQNPRRDGLVAATTAKRPEAIGPA
jgi:hypothetical protein